MIKDPWFWFFSFILGALFLTFLRLCYVTYAESKESSGIGGKYKYSYKCPKRNCHTIFRTDASWLIQELTQEHIQYHIEKRN